MRALFKLLRIIGDVKAAKRGRLPQRIVRRSAHRGLSRGLRKILK